LCRTRDADTHVCARQVEVIGEEIIAYDALAVLALDYPPSAAPLAVSTLLNISESIFRANLVTTRARAAARSVS
jgi:hypothetical protein